MDVISNNLANANTTRTPEGGAYHRRYVVFQPREYDEQKGFGFFMAHALHKNRKNRDRGNGVRAVRIEEDRRQGPLVYDPGHPDANAEGYVERPNVNAVARNAACTVLDE